MENVYPIMLLIFGGAVMLYALLLAVYKDRMFIPKIEMAKVKNAEVYALKLAKILAWIAAGPIAGGLIGFIGATPLIRGISTACALGGISLAIWRGFNLMHGEY
ncbi:MAG: hypothetical protein J5822_07105 [Eubacteriaceae bacterium]|nr:hypothetical protein [Eubacteriaceae bacterium]